MCTAVSLGRYFGRNLDLERSYAESVVITPRHYKFSFRTLPTSESHYAMIGMATVAEGYPLYYEATNEKGLSMAGLNFPCNAYYGAYREGKDNVAPFEFIPYILGICKDTAEALECLENINLVNINFSGELPLSPLHWIISDKEKSHCFESERENVSHFFHILGGVAMPKGCVMTKDGEYEYTRYSCCCNADKGIYYYNTYDNIGITAVDMHDYDLEGSEVYRLDLEK